jgi:hypothetical protein
MMVQTKIISIALFLILFFGCANGPTVAAGGYKGGVVDAASGEPIEGAAVLGIWYKISIGPGGGYPHYLDAHETATDTSGLFSLPGPGKTAPLQEFRLLVFKAGYEALSNYGAVPWGELKEGGILKKEIQWNGSRPTISLRKLSDAEIRARRLLLKPMDVPPDKMPLLTRELAEESRIKKTLRNTKN